MIFAKNRKLKTLTCIVCVCILCLGMVPARSSAAPVSTDHLLDEIQHRAFLFLWREANPENGLVKDRAGNFSDDNYQVASIASVGFALAAIPVAVERQWISKREARKRVLTTLKFFYSEAEHKEGFFYHFLGMNTGRRAWRSEISSIDTALFLAGALVAREYFKDQAITKYVNALYDRINFQWMLNGGQTLSMGWKPRRGFLDARWSDYNEGILLALLALGSRTHPIDPESWNEIKRRRGIYDQIVVVQSPPLFTHQYPHLFFDFRNKHDDNMDYFENSINATEANRRYCMNQSDQYKTFREGYWGLTASDGPTGYKAYGAEPGGALNDGTVAPTAAITSIMFTPEHSVEFTKRLFENESDWLWGRYGFTDSFNLNKKWKSPDVIGIDLGAMLLGIENHRTRLIWKLFSKAPEVTRAMKLAGFKSGRKKLKAPKAPVYSVVEKKTAPDWNEIPSINLTDNRFLEIGSAGGQSDLDIKVQFAWDNKYLYFRALVDDDQVVSTKGGSYIWMNDCLEIFVDPTNKGLIWGKPQYFQIGFSPKSNLDELRTWAWFQDEDPVKKRNVKASVRKLEKGYEISGKIKWNFLKIKPRKGEMISLTPAFHDKDAKGIEKKYNWCFISKDGKFELGKLILK